MTRSKNRRSKQGIALTAWGTCTDSVSPGANGGFGDLQFNLNTEVETLTSSISEGMVAHVTSLTFDVQFYNNDDETVQGVIIPVIVQTAGTFTDTVNLTYRTVEGVIDGCCDDEHGQYAFPMVSIVKEPAVAVAGFAAGARCRVRMPQHLLDILNSETQTEKLQSLIFAVVGSTTINKTFNIRTHYELKYTLVKRSILRRAF